MRAAAGAAAAAATAVLSFGRRVWVGSQDPEFRRQFQVMCAKIGVDPLASNKGFWSEVLGVSDFYFALAVCAACAVSHAPPRAAPTHLLSEVRRCRSWACASRRAA